MRSFITSLKSLGPDLVESQLQLLLY